MKVLVTGGSGGVGRYLVPELVAAGHQVRVLDLRPPAEPGPEYVQGDLTSLETVTRAATGVEGICHLAAATSDFGDAVKHFEANDRGTFHVLEAAARTGVKRLALASSISAGGWGFSKLFPSPAYLPVDEEHPMAPDGPYDMSKYVLEIRARGYHARYGMGILCLRLANVRHEAVSAGAKGLACPPVWATVDPRDVARAFRLALESAIPWGVYIISTRYRWNEKGERETTPELLAGLGALKGHPTTAHVTIGGFKPGFLAECRSAFSCDKAIRDLRYDPRW